MFLNTATGSGEIFPSKVDSAHLVVTRALSYSSLAKVIVAVLENGASPSTTGTKSQPSRQGSNSLSHPEAITK